MAYLGRDYAFRPVARSLQLFRILHVPYWYKTTGMAELVRDWLRHRSREFRAGWNLMWLSLLGLLFLHTLTCSWFYVGLFDGGWLSDSDVLSEPDLLNRYIRSLEWAVSRLPPSRLPSNMELQTRLERFLALTATGLVVVFGAIFTSIITNDMSDIRRSKETTERARISGAGLFRKLLGLGGAATQGEEILTAECCEDTSTWEGGDEIHSTRIPLWRDLSWSLCSDHAKTPVFQAVTNRHAGFTYELTMRCLQDWYVVPDEILFSAGPKCDHMLFVVHGSVNYWMMTSEEESEAERYHAWWGNSV